MSPFRDPAPDRNYWINVWEGSLFIAATALCSVQVILPAWLTQLHASPSTIGFLFFLMFVAVGLPQPWSATWVQPLPYRKPWLWKVGVAQRVPLLAMAIGSWMLAAHPRGLIALTFVCMTAFMLACGIVTPVWVQFIGKITPARQRGRLHGDRLLIGGALGLAASAVGERLLATLPFPFNYSWLFFIAFLLVAGSWALFGLLAEPHPSVVRPRQAAGELLAQVRGVLTHDLRFRRLMLLSPLLQAATFMPMAFHVTFGLQEGLVSPHHVGRLAIVFAAAQAGGSALLGRLGDRRGNLTLLRWAAFLALLAAILPMLFPTRGIGIALGLACSAGALSGSSIAFINLPLELAPPQQEALYVAVFNQLLVAASALAPLAAGLIAHQWGYPAMFTLSAVLAYAGFAVLSALLKSGTRDPAIPAGATPALPGRAAAPPLEAEPSSPD